MTAHVVTVEHHGRTYALAVQGRRVALSDDTGTLYVGHERGLSAHVPLELGLRLAVEKAKAERPLVTCAGCSTPYTRAAFIALPVIDVRDHVEVRLCTCNTVVAAPESGAP